MTRSYDLQALRAFSIQTAQRAGELIKNLRENEANTISSKGNPLDLVTTADVEAERFILTAIKNDFPEHKILSEETLNDASHDKFSGPLWIVDPIDGTVNYAHGHQQVGISIAFAEQGELQTGVVHSPFQNETFAAIRGNGATLNEKPIKIREVKDLRTSLIATGFPYTRDKLEKIVMRVKNVLANCQDIRRIGAASLDLCWVACGRVQGFYEEKLQIWDIAAGRLIATEAGALVTNFEPSPDPSLPPEFNGYCLMASTPNIHDDLHRLLHVS